MNAASYYVKFASTGTAPGGTGAVNAGSGFWEEATGLGYRCRC
jgi:hypothetical protein